MKTYRRISSSEIKNLKRDFFKLKEMQKRYGVIAFNEEYIDYIIDDHTDFTILSVITAYHNDFISEDECDKIIGIVEGYYFAYTEKLISSESLYYKLTEEILEPILHQDVDFISFYWSHFWDDWGDNLDFV